MFWLKKILAISPETQVILMTAFADISIAVESIREGALDFIVKPWENEKLTNNGKNCEHRQPGKEKGEDLEIAAKIIGVGNEPATRSNDRRVGGYVAYKEGDRKSGSY
jgi:DNA-binding NtrC family response regulator